MKKELKRKLFKEGSYSCLVPQGDTTKWTISEWIEWIDENWTWWK